MISVLKNTLFITLIFTAFAGLINGTYAVPRKFVTSWEEENIWFIFFIFGCFILPVSTILILSPDIVKIIPEIPLSYILTLVVGGLFFGIGQLFFSLAFKFIGMGINFVLNISIGTALTALAGLAQVPSLIFTQYGMLQISGILAFFVAVIFGALASASKSKSRLDVQPIKMIQNRSYMIIGISLSLMAGIGSACQGSSYVISNPTVSGIAKSLGYSTLSANLLSWIIIFTAAAIPSTVYFLFLMFKNKTLKNLGSSKTLIYYPYIIIMSTLYWFSVVLFTSASIIIGGALAPTITWPLFMVFIILTSNLWSFIYGEWKNATVNSIIKIWASIIIFICAISLFSYSAIVKNDTHDLNKIEALKIHRQ